MNVSFEIRVLFSTKFSMIECGWSNTSLTSIVASLRSHHFDFVNTEGQMYIELTSVIGTKPIGIIFLSLFRTTLG